MTVTIRPHADGATLAVRAQPGAKRNAILGEQAGALKVTVTAPPEDGRANDAVLDVLRKAFACKRSQVELLGGHTNRNKVVLVRGATLEALTALVTEAMGSPGHC